MVNKACKDEARSVSKMKKTEIGVIPEDWEVVKIANVVNFDNGLAHEGIENENGDFIVINSKFISTEGNVVRKVTKQLKPLLVNDICIVMSDIPNGKALAKCYLIEKNNTYTLNQRIGRITPIKDYPKFLYYVLNRNKYYLSFDSGSGQTNLRKNEVLDCVIPLPPLAEQEAIASALSDADAWIERLEQLIAKKRLIKQGAMQTLLTPKEDWEVKKLGEVGKTYGGLSGKTKVDFGKGNAHYIPFMNVMKNVVIDKSFFEKVNLKQGEVQNKVLKNDLLFNGSSETPEELGISSVILEDIDNLYLNSFCFGFRLFDNNVNPLFLSYLFRSPYGRKIIFYLAQGATRYNLSKANFLELEISVPQSLSEQERIATILSDMDAELEALERQLAKARQIKQGMMQELLTGKTRLIDN